MIDHRKWVQWSLDDKPMWANADYSASTMHWRDTPPPPSGLNRHERRRWEVRQRRVTK